jgi:hypothetical protein
MVRKRVLGKPVEQGHVPMKHESQKERKLWTAAAEGCEAHLGTSA